MKDILIVVNAIAILMCVGLILTTIIARSKIAYSFVCPKCKRMNRKNTGSCKFCNAKMRTALVFRSTLLGRVNCKDSVGKLDLRKSMRNVTREIVLYVIIILVCVSGIIISVCY